MQATQEETILEAVSQEFRMPPEQSVQEWAESNCFLTTIQTDTPGQYSTELTPYVRDCLEDWKDPEVEEMVYCWGAQTSKTMTLMVGVTWMMVNRRKPAMWIMPNKDLAQSFSENRLQPFFEECPPVAKMKPKGRDRHKWKKLEMNFGSVVLNLIGSNSPANLASRPAGILVMDETDKFAESTTKEANAIELAELRTRTFAGAKIAKTSTPSTLDGVIWQAFLAGDQQRYFIPCHNCGEYVVLVQDSDKSVLPKTGKEAYLKWDPKAKTSKGWDLDRVQETAHFVCPHCKGAIEDQHKTAMLREGKWMPTNPNPERGVRSRHLPSFYAPWRKTSFGFLAKEFLKAKASVDGLKGYITGTLAEPDLLQWDGGMTRLELVVQDDKPLVGTVRIMTVDVQQDHFWLVIRDWVHGGHSRLVLWKRVELYEDVRSVQLSHNVKADLLGMDCGHDGPTVHRECARYGWFSMRGDSRKSWPMSNAQGKKIEVPFTVRILDPLIGTHAQGTKNINELRFNPDYFKDILSNLRDPGRSPVRWELTESLATEEYFRHMDGEVRTRVFNKTNGKITYQWLPRSRHWPNHLFDCEVEQVVVAAKLNLLKLQAFNHAN